MMEVAPKKINTALLDIDGTLVDAKNKYNPKLKEVLTGLIRENITVGLITNRALKSSMNYYNEFGLNGPVMFEDGAAIYLPGKEKRINLVTNLVHLNNAKIAIREAISSGKFNHELRRKDIIFSMNGEKEYSISVHLRTTDGARCDDVVAQVVPAVESLLSTSTSLITYDTGRGNFLVRYVDSGKGVGVNYLIKHKLISGGETVIIGDGDNDVPAFSAVKKNGGIIGVVGNATERAKAFADILSEHTYSDGVIDIIEQIKNLNQIRRM